MYCVFFTSFFFALNASGDDDGSWLMDKTIESKLSPYAVLPLSAYTQGSLYKFESAKRWMEVGGFGMQLLIILSNKREAMIIYEISKWSEKDDALVVSRKSYSITLEELKSVDRYLSEMQKKIQTSGLVPIGDDFGFLSSENFDGTDFTMTKYADPTAVNLFRTVVLNILRETMAKK